ncbi:MAG: ATP-binding cassette domain-containing protein [Candidatus Acidiferrales bacterium]|jgi:phospholipid/cholesterol/gamma-HCH transport system ATP-binding protein
MTRAATPAENGRSPDSVVPGDPLIRFNDIHLSSEGYEVLRGVSFQVQPRETKVLLGETGTGKTVLMKMAAGLIRPDEGTVTVMGHDVSAMNEKDLLQFRRQMGFVFQEGALFDSMDVADNVSFRLREENTEETEIHERVVESLKFVEMEHAIDRFPAELSGGMRRRVSIARALIDKPPIVFYDSPTAGLDPVTSQTIINLILRGRDLQDVTSMLATHRVQDAFGLANYRFDKATGKVVHSGTMEMSEDGTRVVPVKTNASSNRDAAGLKPQPTNVVVLHEGVIYFEGAVDDLLKTEDPYLKKFLASAE